MKLCWSVWGLLSSILPGLVAAQSIYTCVDAKGNRLSSDRVIAECLDREQRELNPSGTLRRPVSPALTDQQRADQAESARQAERERMRRIEQTRRDQALLELYPDPAAYDRVRSRSLLHIETTIKAAKKQVLLLLNQRQPLDAESEFFNRNPARMPATLKSKLEENNTALESQRRLILAQESDKARLNARFDETLARLRPLWQAYASTGR
jgi:hypothetical protein